MTRQQEKVVLARLETVRKQKVEAISQERRARNAKVLPVGARVSAYLGKHKKQADGLFAALLASMQDWGAYGYFPNGCKVVSALRDLAHEIGAFEQVKAETAEIDRDCEARIAKLNAAAENLAVRLVLGNDADEVLKLLDAFVAEKF